MNYEEKVNTAEGKKTAAVEDLRNTLFDLLMLTETFEALSEGFAKSPGKFSENVWTMPTEQLYDLVTRANDLFDDLFGDSH